MPFKRNAAGLFTLLAVAAALTLAGCGKQEAPAAPKSAPQVGVVVVKAQQVAVTTVLPGRTSPYQIAEVRPQIGGIVLQRLFREGADVKAGETLYQIDPALYKATYDSAHANLAKSEANLATVKLKAERYRELVKINAVSKQDFDDAEAAEKQAPVVTGMEPWADKE